MGAAISPNGFPSFGDGFERASSRTKARVRGICDDRADGVIKWGRIEQGHRVIFIESRSWLAEIISGENCVICRRDGARISELAKSK